MTKNLISKLAIVTAIGVFGHGAANAQCVGCAGGNTPVFSQSNVVGSYGTSMVYSTPVSYSQPGMVYTSGRGYGTYTTVTACGGSMINQRQSSHGTYTRNACQAMPTCYQQNACCVPQKSCGNTTRWLGNRRMAGYQNCCGGTQVMTNACGSICGSVAGYQPVMNGCVGCAGGIVTPVMGGQGEIVTPPVAEDDATPPVPETEPGQTVTEGEVEAEGDT